MRGRDVRPISDTSTRGVVLVTTVLFLVVIIATVTAALTFTLTENSDVQEDEARTSALNLAEAGLQASRYEIADRKDLARDGLGNVQSDGPHGDYAVNATGLPNGRRQLLSTATALGQELTVKEVLRVKDPISDYAVFGERQVRFGSHVTILSGMVGNAHSGHFDERIRVANGVTIIDGIKGDGPVHFGERSVIINGLDDPLTPPPERLLFGAILTNKDVRIATHTRITGDINSGGEVVLGDDVIVDGNVTAAEDARLTGRARVTGSVISDGNPITFAGVEYPEKTTPEPGTISYSTNAASYNLDITPGHYDAVSLRGFRSTITLHSGEYHFSSFFLSSFGKLKFDVSNGPISIFVKGRCDFNEWLDVFVSTDGTNYLSPFATDADPALQQLASKVWWEVQGVGVGTSLPCFSHGHHSEWFGTVYVPSGGARTLSGACDLRSGPDSKIAGAFWTDGWVDVAYRNEMEFVLADRYKDDVSKRITREAWTIEPEQAE